MTVSVGLQFISAPNACMGAPIGTDKYQYGHQVAYLPDRLFTGPVKICRMGIQCDGFTGSGGGCILIFLDKKKRASLQSLAPKTQNADYMYMQLLAQMPIVQTPQGIMLHVQELDPPVEYVPGEDCIVLVKDGTASTNPVGFVWLPSLAMDATPTWPDDMPEPNCTTGNDIHTRLLLHCDGPDGFPSFQDASWRNYTVRSFGGMQHFGGWAHFDGTAILAPELYAPGYGIDTDPSHIDWNVSDDDFTLDLQAQPLALTSCGTIAIEGAGYGPFIVRQEGAAYKFYGSTTGSSWNLSGSLGTAAVNTAAHLAVVRSGGSILLFKDGTLTDTIAVSGALHYATASGLPKGRMVFGAQADIDVSGNVSAGNYFVGRMKEIRFSKIARWTTNFTPPAGPYTP